MPLFIPDRSSATPLGRQVRDALRGRILSGELASGTRLPSTREAAEEWGVSRNVVLEAFEQLAAEGCLEARRGSGHYVAPGAAFRTARLPAAVPVPPVGFRPPLGRGVDFRSGLPDLGLFPVHVWRRLDREVWNRITPRDLSYGQPEGRLELRREIAQYLAAARGVRCGPEQILVTAGTTQAVGIVTRLLLAGEARTCLLEDPLTADIRRIVAGCGGLPRPVPVDEQGLRTEELPHDGEAAFSYVTPSHQFPTGATMPVQRRIRLLEWARRRRAYVVEDDYDSEFRYDAPPVSTLQGLDPLRVVYVGTFSKTLCPALRIGYVVLPPELVRRGREWKWFSDLHNSSVEQLVLARFLAEGCFERHIHRMRKVYKARRAALVEELDRRFGSRAEILGSAAGIHLCARFREVRFTPDLLSRLERDGARFYPVEEHAARKGRWRDTLILGYGTLDEERIREGLAVLARGLRGTRRPGSGRASTQPTTAHSRRSRDRYTPPAR